MIRTDVPAENEIIPELKPIDESRPVLASRGF